MEKLRTDDNPTPAVVLSDTEWKKRLTPEQYRVLRTEGTEACFTGVIGGQKGGTLRTDGTTLGVDKPFKYHCAGCGLSLFTPETKFESGTGWPSFFKPIEGHIATKTDWKLAMARTEVHCARCEGHLGHVFPDGPPPTGMRYCINAAALTFEES